MKCLNCNSKTPHFYYQLQESKDMFPRTLCNNCGLPLTKAIVTKDSKGNVTILYKTLEV